MPTIELNSTVAQADRPRLGKQHRKLVAMLSQRPWSNDQLTSIVGLRFGARLHELKKAGCLISKSQEKAGLVTYTLDYCPEGLVEN